MPKFSKPFPTSATVLSRDVIDYRKITPVKVREGDSQSALPPVDPNFLESLTAATSFMKFTFTNGAASNNWVVGAKKSASGKPILSNDPHLGHMLPSGVLGRSRGQP